MGHLLSTYKKAIFDELVNSITSNTSQYYAFASNPIEAESLTEISKDRYSSFEATWKMIFGKKITANDIMPVIKKNIWVPNKIYDRYDNKSETIYDTDNYYVITEPSSPGGDYHVYLCIDNNNGSPSTKSPSDTEIPTQQFSEVYNFLSEPDKYVWRYITSITSIIYDKFSTNEYVPIYTNNNVLTTASISSGVDFITVVDGGKGYTSYANGIISEAINVSGTTRIKISNTSSDTPNFYKDNSIYIFDDLSPTIQPQLKNIKEYIVTSPSEKFIITDTPLTLSSINPGSTKYSITPKVVIESDSDVQPKAVSVVNTSTNSISEVIIYEDGLNLTWANAYIVSGSVSNAAVLQTIVAPPGGHGIDPAVELNIKGYCVSFNFSDTENGTILASNTIYNKIGILKNPNSLDSSGTFLQKGSVYSKNTFSSLLKANVDYTFIRGETVTGDISKARGIVAFSNSTQVFIVGDKHFANGETISTNTLSGVTTLNIKTRGDVYIKDLIPLYVQNINNVNREPNQTESFKLIIKL